MADSGDSDALSELGEPVVDNPAPTISQPPNAVASIRQTVLWSDVILG